MSTIKSRRRPRSGQSTEQVVLDTIRKGYKNRDPSMLVSVYAEDVEYTVVNRNNPPSKRLVLRGRAAMQRMFEDLCAREMTHDVIRTSAGDNSISYLTLCRYPDGCQVVSITMATLRNGRIVNEFSVDCWDE
ncbi:MAG: nuclear transport factor 2 family protein [Sulfurifustis sp.]